MPVIGPNVQGQGRPSPRGGGEERFVDAINVGVNAKWPLEEAVTIPKERDGVPASPTVSYGLEVSRIGITFEDPLLGPLLAPIASSSV